MRRSAVRRHKRARTLRSAAAAQMSSRPRIRVYLPNGGIAHYNAPWPFFRVKDALKEVHQLDVAWLVTKDEEMAVYGESHDVPAGEYTIHLAPANAGASARAAAPSAAGASASSSSSSVPRSAVTVQLYDTSHTCRITPDDSYAEFRAQAEDAFSGYLNSGSGKLKFTLHYYRIEDDPTDNSKVKLDHDDPAVSAQRWAKYRHTYSEATIVLFAFSDAEPAERRSPLRDRMPDGLRISVPPLKPPFPSSASNSAKERISPTLSGKAKERDGKLCVMCDALPVQSYGAHIIPHGDEAWCQAAGLLVPPALAWFVEQPINVVTLCDDCHKLFDDKAALWVEVDAAAADPAHRLKVTLHGRVPDCSDELLARCRARFPPSSQRFVRVPSGQRADSFPCWSSYDALWCYRLRWSQAKHALLCQAEDDARQRDALKAKWDGTCGFCRKKGNGACTRSFSCKKCCGNAGGCAAAQHPDTRAQGASASAAAGAADGSCLAAAAMRGLRIGK